MQIIKDAKKTDLLVLPFWQGKERAEAACEIASFKKEIAFPLESKDFMGKQGETLLVYAPRLKEKRLLLLGLGEKKKCSLETLRSCASAFVKACRCKKIGAASFQIPHVDGMKSKEVCFAISEGALLANYAFNALKHEALKENAFPSMERLCFVGTGKEEIAYAHRAMEIVSAANMARDLVNGNADDVTPQALCKKALELQKSYPSLKVKVLGKKELEKEKMGLLLAVSRGSAVDPALIVIEYRGNPKSKEKVALIGKGVTYDTGGLNMKQIGQMETMRCDMAGAAAVLGTLRATAALSLKVNLVGIIPTTENAVGPLSFKPGDVYVSHSGKTVEISNTDAEGRLVLADALSYVQEHHAPTRMVDLATLTGGIVVALGEEVSGLFSNDDALAQKLMEAGEKTYERLWRFPLYSEYFSLLKSSIADIQNSGGRKASSITGALFLKSFVKDIPWAHLDIAGTAFISEAKSYHPTHATGVGVRLLIEFLDECAPL